MTGIAECRRCREAGEHCTLLLLVKGDSFLILRAVSSCAVADLDLSSCLAGSSFFDDCCCCSCSRSASSILNGGGSTALELLCRTCRRGVSLGGSNTPRLLGWADRAREFRCRRSDWLPLSCADRCVGRAERERPFDDVVCRDDSEPPDPFLINGLPSRAPKLLFPASAVDLDRRCWRLPAVTDEDRLGFVSTYCDDDRLGFFSTYCCCFCSSLSLPTRAPLPLRWSTCTLDDRLRSSTTYLETAL